MKIQIILTPFITKIKAQFFALAVYNCMTFIQIIFDDLCYRLLGVIEQNVAYMYNGLLSHLYVPVGEAAMVLAAHCEESEGKTVYSTCMFTMYI